MEMIRDGDVRALLEASHRLGSDSRLVFEYTDLFEVSRPLSHKKRLRLVKEIEELLEVCRFRDGGRTHRNISRAGILAGIKEVCNRDVRELKNHNYLYKVLKSVAETEEKEALIKADKAHRRKEKRLRRGDRRDDPGQERRWKEGAEQAHKILEDLE